MSAAAADMDIATNKDAESPIYMATVSAPTNIACVKYWGKASIEYNTPINSSVSVTLDQTDLRAVTTASASELYASDRLWLNGVEVPDAASSKRFRACVDGVKNLATDRVDDATGRVVVSKEQWSGMRVHVSSYNTFPTAAGLASSAAGYAALVSALAELFGARETYPGELSALARQGSGSACRSMYGGFVAWRMGSKDGGCGGCWSDSIAEQIATEDHWPEIRAVIMVVSDAKKDMSSTSGMSTSVKTSALLGHRASTVVPERMESIEAAFLERDFETFGRITMADSNQFHAVCQDTYPPIFYMNDISRGIVRVVHAYNSWAGRIRAAYTFDAGPNAVLYTLEEHVVELLALMLRFYPLSSEDGGVTNGGCYINNLDVAERARAHKLDEDLVAAVEKTGRDVRSGDIKKIYYTKSGPGPLKLGPDEAIIDPKTGLNTYHGSSS